MHPNTAPKLPQGCRTANTKHVIAPTVSKIGNGESLLRLRAKAFVAWARGPSVPSRLRGKPSTKPRTPCSFVNDNSRDQTENVLKRLEREIPELRYVNNAPPNGFGFAVRMGLVNPNEQN